MIDREDWCLWCGETLPDDRPWSKVYCNRTCQQRANNRIATERRRAEIIKPIDCGWCGQALSPERNAHRLFCSTTCQSKAAARRRTERRQAEKLTLRPCAWCKREFRPKRRSNARCCSQQCQVRWWRARRDPEERRAYDRQWLAKLKAAQPLKPCAWCGTMFQPSGRPGRAHRFCSQSCVNKNRWKRDKVPVEPRNCAQCGKEFLPEKPSSRVRHCSRRCGYRAIAKPLPAITCEGCHKTFTPKRHRPSRPARFCSRDCFWEHQRDRANPADTC